jgi:alanine-glyoxylate transaminase / serine-glyoxylate transaminase / serine-pyruvate transaminase
MKLTNLPSVSSTHRIAAAQLDVPPRLLMGPGPSNAHPRVLQALSMRQVGHLDPAFLQLMNEIQELLRYAWQTNNDFTVAVSGTGSAAMEAAIASIVEPGDQVLVAVNGYFGERMCEMVRRHGGMVQRIEKPWGEVYDLDELRTAVQAHRPVILGIVHAETSTGAGQPLEGLGALCREHDCLLLVDTVTSLGGVPLFVDSWNIDVAYGGSQKCLSCPPGIAPLTMGSRAMDKLKRRQTSVGSWYLDMSLVSQYWGQNRAYHHTAPINMNYAFREALRLVAEEGLEERWQRHRNNAELLWMGLSDLGLSCHVPYDHRLPSLTTVRVPEGTDAGAVARYLLGQYNIEIAGGLGQLAGKVWRIGLMGFNSRPENVLLLLKAMEEILAAK